jgi:predicted nucleic acid-binding Zn ribbon protein
MHPEDDITAKISVILALLAAKFGIKTRRAQAGILLRAQAAAGNPRLERQMDSAQINHAYVAVSAHLRGIDVRERRRSRLLRMAGTIVFYLLVVITAFVVWLWWRGYV